MTCRFGLGVRACSDTPNMISVDGERLLGVAEPRPGSSAAVGL